METRNYKIIFIFIILISSLLIISFSATKEIKDFTERLAEILKRDSTLYYSLKYKRMTYVENKLLGGDKNV